MALLLGYPRISPKQRAKGFDQGGQSRLDLRHSHYGVEDGRVKIIFDFDADLDGFIPDDYDLGSGVGYVPFDAGNLIGRSFGDSLWFEPAVLEFGTTLVLNVFPEDPVVAGKQDVHARDGVSPQLRTVQRIFWPGIWLNKLGSNFSNNQSINGNRSSFENDFDGNDYHVLKSINFLNAEVQNAEFRNFKEGIEVVAVNEAPNLTRFDPLPSSLLGISYAQSNFIAANINTIIAACNLLETIASFRPSPLPTVLTNTCDTHPSNIDLSGKTGLKIILLNNGNDNTGIQTISFPVSMPNLNTLHIGNCGFNDDVTLNTIFDTYKSQLRIFQIEELDNLTWAKAFVSADIPSVMEIFGIANSGVNGNVIFDQPNNLNYCRLSRGNSNNNSIHQIIDISGCTKLTGAIELRNCQADEIHLPILDNPNSIANLYTQRNNVDIATSPTFNVRINSYVGITSCLINDLATVPMNLGAVFTLSNLVNMVTLNAVNIGITELVLPLSSSSLATMIISSNTLLTTLTNLAVNSGLITVGFSGCTVLNVDFSLLPNIRVINCSTSGQNVIDLSSRTSTLTISGFTADFCPGLITVNFPANPANAILQTSIRLRQNDLQNITNMENVDATFTNNTAFLLSDNPNLNLDLPFGQNNLKPRNMDLRNCAFSQINVDSMINRMYTNRIGWDTIHTLAITVSLNGGTNDAPTGTFQAPAGFVLGISDGIPTSPQEEIFVLVNNYGWIISTN